MPGHNRMRVYMLRIFLCATALLFVLAEFFVFFAIHYKRRLHLEGRPDLYLLPFLAVAPLIAGFQAYRHIKRHLSSNAEKSLWLPILCELAMVVGIGYAALVITLGFLLRALQSVTS